MGKIILVTGGARSGKSRLAEKLAAGFGSPLGYLATASPGDAEMAARIARHRERRGPEWATMEEPLDLAGVLAGHDGYFRAIMVDCVTLWLSNLILTGMGSEDIEAEVKRVIHQLAALQTPVILVSNEVGMGIVPENRLARSFRDLAGIANQLLAEAADEVHVAISGLPLRLKG
jgi:adenosylcobinamide kinase/adenosylcobinamide-phosphate guanylyltransferase